MTTLTSPKFKTKQCKAQKPESSYKRPHAIVPIEDMLWASQQSASVSQLWQECWTSDPYGSRWMVLNHTLGYSTFIAAKKVLTEKGLFVFKPEKSIRDGRETSYWKVLNLHGSRVKDFWNQEVDSAQTESCADSTEVHSGNSEIDAKNLESILIQSQSEQGFQNPSRTPQELLTISSKEIVSSDSTAERENCEGVATPPLGGASPTDTQAAVELEEGVTDCSQAPEPVNTHDRAVPINYLEDEFSAPPPAFFETRQSISDRIANKKKLVSDLKMFCDLEAYPGLDFLLKCWNEGSPELKQRVRKALERYPDWAEITDEGELVEANQVPWDKIAKEMEQLY
jgi:hypothetical protein